jgi:hypothetical protein
MFATGELEDQDLPEALRIFPSASNGEKVGTPAGKRQLVAGGCKWGKFDSGHNGPCHKWEFFEPYYTKRRLGEINEYPVCFPENPHFSLSTFPGKTSS